MKIGVIADTHIPAYTSKLPQKVADNFKECDLIVHVGDAVEAFVIEALNKIAPTKAVCGNMDSNALRESLPEKMVLEVQGKKIGVIHGSGPSFKVFQNVRKAFSGKPDIVLFGHSHIPFNEVIDGTLYFNPGSATDRVFAKFCSFGIVSIEDGKIRAEIVRCDPT